MIETNITLQQLLYLVAVDRCGTFVDAAAECRVSQPALSMQIRKLENSLGVKLFDRSRQPVRPTAIGRRVIGQARLALREAGRLQELVDLDQGEMTGTWRLGLLPSLAVGRLARGVARFLEAHTGLSVRLHERTREELIEDLGRDRLDAALMVLPSGADSLEDRHLYDEPLAAVVPRSHPLYQKEMIGEGDLEPDDLLPIVEPDGLGSTVVERLGFNPSERKENPSRIVWRGGGPDAHRRLAEAGVAVALIPEPIADEMRGGPAADMIRVFAPPVPTRSIGIVLPPAGARQHISDAFVATLLAV